MKILGKRFGSNINTLAGYLYELAKEHSRKKPGRSKRKIESVKDAKNYIRKGPITPQSRMMIAEDKYLAKDMDLRKSILDTKKSIKEDRRRLPRDLQRNRLTIKPIHKASPPTKTWTPHQDYPQMGIAKYGRSQFYDRPLSQSPSDQLRIGKQRLKMKQKEIEKLERNMKRMERVLEGRQAQRSAMRTGLAQGIAGPALMIAADKLLYPVLEKGVDHVTLEYLIPLNKRLEQLTIGNREKENRKQLKRKKTKQGS